MDNEVSLQIIENAVRTNQKNLDLSENKLSSLPSEIGKLTNLTHLNLEYNQLSSLPSEIGKLTNLTHLNLEYNQLSSLPSEIGKLTNLTHLNLINNQLSSLPSEIGKLTNLTHLNLINNRLSSLPSEIGKLTNLTHLNLINNKLSSLPSDIGKLTHLNEFCLYINQLSSLPSEIGNLTNLTHLWLCNNQLSSLPSEIGKLTNLTRLDLENNQLSSLPSEIGNLTNLTELLLDYKILNSLPFKIEEPIKNSPMGYCVLLNENLNKFLGYHRQIKSQDSLADLEKEISDYINKSSKWFSNEFIEFEKNKKKVWVLKYFSPSYLLSFQKNGSRLFIARSPGFTWGDGIYLTSIKNPYSSMMYGSIGVMGWIDANNIRIYDACSLKGIDLYQRWIVHTKGLYSYLTTTVHADWANRILRNNFQKRFNIDIVVFHPDQSNTKYCDKKQDFWFLVSDRTNGNPSYSNKINDCKPLIVVGESFEKSNSGLLYKDLVGKSFIGFNCSLHDAPNIRGKPSSTLISNLIALHSRKNEMIIVRP